MLNVSWMCINSVYIRSKLSTNFISCSKSKIQIHSTVEQVNVCYWNKSN